MKNSENCQKCGVEHEYRFKKQRKLQNTCLTLTSALHAPKKQILLVPNLTLITLNMNEHQPSAIHDFSTAPWWIYP